MRRLAAHGMALDVLDQDVAGGAAVDGDLDHLSGMGQCVAEDPRVDREVLWVLAAAVDDARDEALATEATRGARALRIASAEC